MYSNRIGNLGGQNADFLMSFHKTLEKDMKEMPVLHFCKIKKVDLLGGFFF